MMSTDKSVSKASISSAAGVVSGFEEFPDAQDDWEFELDLMGTNASIEALERHLDKVPDPQSATAQFLKGYIASHAQVSR